MTDAAPALAANNLSVVLGGRQVLEGVSLAVRPGELLAIIGPNGAGKTTLIRALAGIVPYEGKVLLGAGNLIDEKPAVRARKIAYLPQGHMFYWPLTVAEIVALGRLPHGAGASMTGADRAAVDRAMAECGVTGFARRKVTTLSGGERSRVALARTLAVESDVILADEPTTSLDPRYQLIVLQLLKARAAAGKAVAIVLHDLALASRFADRVAILQAGHLVTEGAPANVLTDVRIAAVFGISAAMFERDGVRLAVPWSITA